MATPAPAGKPSPARPWQRARVGVVALLGVVLSISLVLGVVLAAALGWTLATERGSAWLLAALPGVTVSAPHGSVIGDFDATRLTVHLPGGASVDLTAVGWRGLRVTLSASAPWVHLSIDELRAARVDVRLASAVAPATPPKPRVAPVDLRLPVALDLRALRIAELHFNKLNALNALNVLSTTPIGALDARGVHLGAQAGAEHRIEQLTLTWDRLQARASARIATRAPLALDASLSVVQAGATPAAPGTSSFAPPPDWRAQATLTGPLAAPQLRIGMSAPASPSSGRAAQSLSVNATLRPFARWPLGDVAIRARALDLAAFSRAAPTTALSGQADASTHGADQPARVAIELTNALAGRWNEGRLPLRQLTLALAGRPDQADTLTLQSFAAELGSAQASAGQLSGAGRWSLAGWSLAATLRELQTERLDARAPAMRLNGTLKLGGGAVAAAGRVEVKADLSGSVADRGQSRVLTLAVDAGVSAQRVEMRALHARAGGASASASGLLTHPNPAAPWAVRANAALVDVDPGVWWPGWAQGHPQSTHSAGANRLNARATVDLSLATAQLNQPLSALLAALHGSADLTLADSRLAGVPLSGAATLRRGATAPALVASVTLDVAGNHMHADGRLSPNAAGADDAWDLRVDAPALARLAPVAALWAAPAAGTGAALAGGLNAHAELTGRWPALTTHGELSASALRLGRFSVPSAAARWRAGTATNAPVEAELTLAGATAGAGAASIAALRLQVTGTARAHNVQLRAESSALPPAWTDAFVPAGTTPAGRTVAVLQASGGLVDAPSAALAGWRGALQQIELRTEAATPAPSAPPANTLLRARDIALEFFWTGGAPHAVVQPGRADVLGGALRWSRLAWQAAARAGAPAQVDADIDIEPLRIAPLLARLQPDFGWGGDLRIGARLALHSKPNFSADLVIERRSGDLTVTDELATQTLGLTDLRLALTAKNGVWTFTQAVAGSALGAGAGAFVVRTTPQALWPTPDAPIEGTFDLQVARLSNWGNWVPPGWRIDGALRTNASIGGRFGAPQYTGQITATQLSVRNFLQGVNLSDGDVAIRLQGTSAQIERFSARGGAGNLKVEGGATFGEAPQAQLTLTAQRFELLGRVDRRIVASGQARLRLDAKQIGVDGQFNVDEGLIDFSRADAPTLGSDVEVHRSPADTAKRRAALAPAPALPVANTGTRRDVTLDLRVALGEKLRVRGHGLDSGLRGELRITSPGGRLAVNGTVRTVDGTYAAYGQKLTIDRGEIVFSGDVASPRLDIEATRPNLDLRVGVAVTGSAVNPRVRLFSEPELSEMDKLSWLVMGRASDGLGRADTALLQRAALALLSGERGGITEQFTKAIGLDDLSMRQSEGVVRDTVISLGKQLSSRWYVGYERGLNATAGSWQLVYRIARRFTLRAQSGEENSLDLIWTWRWR